MANNALIPAMLSFNAEGKEIDITDYQINIGITNNSYYNVSSNNASAGDKYYALHKGAEIELDTELLGTQEKGSVVVSVLKTPDKKLDKSIEELHKLQQDTQSSDPKNYVHPFSIVLYNSEKKIFSKIDFSGFVKEIKSVQDAKTKFLKYEVYIEIFDIATLSIKK